MNLNSLNNKVSYISNLIASNSISILSVCETWLVRSDSSSFVELAGYGFFRGDALGERRKHGTGLYVAREFSPTLIDVPISNVVAVFLTKLQLHVISVYRPPSYSAEGGQH